MGNGRLADELRASEQNLISDATRIAEDASRFAVALEVYGSTSHSPVSGSYIELEKKIALHKAHVKSLFTLVSALLGADGVAALREVMK